MKTFIYIFGIVFCLVGCGKTELPSNITEDHGGDENPVRELTSEEKKIVGTYDPIGGSSRLIFQENGMVVYTVWDKKKEEVKWEIQNGELVVFWEESFGVGTTIYRPNKHYDKAKRGDSIKGDPNKVVIKKNTTTPGNNNNNNNTNNNNNNIIIQQNKVPRKGTRI